jgi:2-polyprenyl-6-methoxyphenol hydroxylase-like FAD-dependent oxidoreductase
MNDSLHRSPVAIVGGGPVGMMLALFLDRHGVPCVIFNQEETSRWHPKGSTHNARTMEHYRRLGLSDAIRQLGLPGDHPTDVAWFTRYDAHELARVFMPSEHEKMGAVIAAPCTVQTVEPIHRANQMYVERHLVEHLRTRPGITLRFGWRVSGFVEDAGGVSLEVERVTESDGAPADSYFDQPMRATGATERWRVDYAVGCDGGHSPVRRALGIRYEGHDTLDQPFLGGAMIASYLRAPELRKRCFSRAPAWQYWAVNPQIRTALVSLDGADEYLYWTRLAPGATFDPADVIRGFHQACGHESPVELLSNRNWTAGVALWAERLWSGGRVFLAGDAIHLFTPTGGFGMNTGIDGVANLAWKLAARVQGWGGGALLASYEAERKPIARRNTTAAQGLARNVGAVKVDAAMEEDSARGEAARRDAGDYLATFGEEFGSIGVQLGVRYDGSPLVIEDGAPPPDSFTSYTPSGVPGGRAPHFFLDPPGMRRRRSLFDTFGTGFTLLRLGSHADSTGAGELIAAAARRGVPLVVVDVPDADARELYGRDLALIRPDQHVAWRGDRVGDARALIDQVTGWPRSA